MDPGTVAVRVSASDMARRTTTALIPTLPEPAAIMMLTATGTAIPHATRRMPMGPIDGFAFGAAERKIVGYENICCRASVVGACIGGGPASR